MCLKQNFMRPQLNQTTDRKNENNNCLNKLNEFNEIQFLTDSESFSVISKKTKKKIFLKKYFLSRTAKVDP